MCLWRWACPLYFCVLSKEEHYFVAAAPRRMRDVWKHQNASCTWKASPAELRNPTDHTGVSNKHAFSVRAPALKRCVLSTIRQNWLLCVVLVQGYLEHEAELSSTSFSSIQIPVYLPCYEDLMRQYMWKSLANRKKTVQCI